MRVIRGKGFKGGQAWAAQDVACVDGISVRLHWTDAPYRWHVNDGQEVFVVLDGVVDMYYREDGGEAKATLEAGDIFFADTGCQHYAHPRGEARVLVVERAGSV